MTGRPLAIYGAGGLAREVAWLLAQLDPPNPYDIVAFVEDGATGHRVLRGAPVLSWEGLCTDHPAALVTVAVGDPAARARIAARCAAHGFAFARLVHRGVAISEFVRLGTGVTICSGSVLTVDIDLGDHVLVNMDCTIGHDVRIGECTTLAPGVHVSGNVQIGRQVYVGTGATIVNGTPDRPLIIGDGAAIAAGACITNAVEPQALYSGVPARRYR